MTSTDGGGRLVLIGAHRPLSNPSPLYPTLTTGRRAAGDIHMVPQSITLHPLTYDHVRQWIVDVCRQQQQQETTKAVSPRGQEISVQALAEQIMTRTQGNPFLVRQALCLWQQQQQDCYQAQHEQLLQDGESPDSKNAVHDKVPSMVWVDSSPANDSHSFPPFQVDEDDDWAVRQRLQSQPWAVQALLKVAA